PACPFPQGPSTPSDLKNPSDRPAPAQAAADECAPPHDDAEPRTARRTPGRSCAQTTEKSAIIIRSSCSRLWQCRTERPRHPSIGTSTSAREDGPTSTVSIHAEAATCCTPNPHLTTLARPG